MDITHRTVCVFCASSDFLLPEYHDLARDLGRELVDAGFDLVYGGGNNGLMGVLSDTVHECGGRLIGVIPRALRDLGYMCTFADEMIVTDGLRERKAEMEERADAFLGLPGGFGTIEELAEIITLRQLGMHDKPIVLVNAFGFFDGLIALFERGYRERFISESSRRLYQITDSARDAVLLLREALSRG